MDGGYGFDLGKNFAFLDPIADVGKLNGNHRTERTLNIIGQAELNMFVVDSDPYMLFADFDFLFGHIFKSTIERANLLSRANRRDGIIALT